MRVIPVMDLKQGEVVRGVGGRRHEYRPIVSQLVGSAEPWVVARALIKAFSAEIYVADLDAITANSPDFEIWDDISSHGCSLLVDAGIRTAAEAKTAWRQLQLLGDHRLVIGLESIANAAELSRIVQTIVPPDRLVFSLDLKQGAPLASDNSWQRSSPLEIARQVYDLGPRRMIVLDLADVGGGRGPSTLPLVRELRQELPGVELIAGGGVRGPDDLVAMEQAGCSAALVASALHDGRIRGRGGSEELGAG